MRQSCGDISANLHHEQKILEDSTKKKTKWKPLVWPEGVQQGADLSDMQFWKCCTLGNGTPYPPAPLPWLQCNPACPEYLCEVDPQSPHRWPHSEHCLHKAGEADHFCLCLSGYSSATSWWQRLAGSEESYRCRESGSAATTSGGGQAAVFGRGPISIENPGGGRGCDDEVADGGGGAPPGTTSYKT